MTDNGPLHKVLWLIHATMLAGLVLTVGMIVGGMLFALVALPFLH